MHSTQNAKIKVKVMTETVLEVNDLHVSFYAAGDKLSGVDFHLNKGNVSNCWRIWIWKILTKAITKLFKRIQEE